mmetsp:Transcript_17129/g.53755  ORF Transcript_17129/g.53755 Transcript_17129/m.53755 type:complete len:308 (-) Transcript_17129:463-1386(-)
MARREGQVHGPLRLRAAHPAAPGQAQEHRVLPHDAHLKRGQPRSCHRPRRVPRDLPSSGAVHASVNACHAGVVLGRAWRCRRVSSEHAPRADRGRLDGGRGRQGGLLAAAGLARATGDEGRRPRGRQHRERPRRRGHDAWGRGAGEGAQDRDGPGPGALPRRARQEGREDPPPPVGQGPHGPQPRVGPGAMVLQGGEERHGQDRYRLRVQRPLRRREGCPERRGGAVLDRAQLRPVGERGHLRVDGRQPRVLPQADELAHRQRPSAARARRSRPRLLLVRHCLPARGRAARRQERRQLVAAVLQGRC